MRLKIEFITQQTAKQNTTTIRISIDFLLMD